MPALKRSLHLVIPYSLHLQSPDSLSDFPLWEEMSHPSALISQTDDEKEHLFLAAYLKLERKIKHESVLFPAFLQLFFQQALKSWAEVFLQENVSVLVRRVFLNAS